MSKPMEHQYQEQRPNLRELQNQVDIRVTAFPDGCYVDNVGKVSLYRSGLLTNKKEIMDVISFILWQTNIDRSA